jgi:hypothetical protein
VIETAAKMESKRVVKQIAIAAKMNILEEVDRSPHIKRVELARRLNIRASTVST